MSEQTPDTESGMADGQDPSMEDILASIRKIIAEDDVQASAAAVTADVVTDTSNLGGDVSELGHMETLDLDIIADEAAPAGGSDIDALIGDMDAAVSEDIAPVMSSEENLLEDSLGDILDLEIPLDETEALAEVETPDVSAEIDLVETETLTLEDELIDLVADVEQNDVSSVTEDKANSSIAAGAVAAVGLAGAAAMGKADDIQPEADVNEQDDLSLMLDNMLEDSSSYEEELADTAEDRVVDPAEDLIADDVSGEDLLAELDFVEDSPETDDIELSEAVSTNDPDIDLVKSLMADLSETPLHDEVESDEVEQEEAEVEIAASGSDDDLDVSSDDIMDEILSVTIDDEAKLSEEIAIPEMIFPPVEDAPSENLSLKEIAAAAEAEAQASETGLSTNLAAGLGAAAIGGVATIAVQDEAPEIEAPEGGIGSTEMVEETNDDVDEALSQLDNLLAEEDPADHNTLTPEPIIEETPEMPRAKKTDAIIDEVTETATAGAFASLTNVVEEKATVAERGDRIGDLVMEALQPMLKEWLDANLKGIVERAVTKEVKRISSGK